MTLPRLLLILPTLALPLAAGWRVALLLTPWAAGSARLFRASLGAMLGLGLGSFSYMAWRWMGGPGTALFLWMEPFAFAALLLILHRLPVRHGIPDTAAPPPEGVPVGWKIILGISGAATAGIHILRTLADPHGGWDAWAIWNLKARFLVRGEAHWLQLGSPVLDWTHPDYPLLLPSTVARWWTFAGTEGLFWPALAAFLPMVLCAGILAGVLMIRRKPAAAWLSATCLLGTYPMVLHATYQGPDLLLGAFMTAAAACLVLHLKAEGRGLLVLAGACAGLAAWTKNEGLLFLPVLAASLVWIVRKRKGMGGAVADLIWMGMGALPGLLTVAALKLSVPAGNDLMAGLTAGAIGSRLADPIRYWLILKAFSIGSLKLIMPAALVLLWAASGFKRSPEHARGGRICLTAAGLMLLMYGLVYLLTPHDLAWHLSTSAVRLIIGIWPLALLGFLLTAQFEE